MKRFWDFLERPICSHSFIHSPKIMQRLICAIPVGINLKCGPVLPSDITIQLVASAPVALPPGMSSGLQAHLFPAGLPTRPAPSSHTSNLTSPMALGASPPGYQPEQGQSRAPGPGPCPACPSQSCPLQKWQLCLSIHSDHEPWVSLGSPLSLTAHIQPVNTCPWLSQGPWPPPASRPGLQQEAHSGCRAHPCPILDSRTETPAQLTSAHAALPPNPQFSIALRVQRHP